MTGPAQQRAETLDEAQAHVLSCLGWKALARMAEAQGDIALAVELDRRGTGAAQAAEACLVGLGPRIITP